MCGQNELYGAMAILRKERSFREAAIASAEHIASFSLFATPETTGKTGVCRCGQMNRHGIMYCQNCGDRLE